jgi:hypothetical protein
VWASIALAGRRFLAIRGPLRSFCYRLGGRRATRTASDFSRAIRQAGRPQSIPSPRGSVMRISSLKVPSQCRRYDAWRPAAFDSRQPTARQILAIRIFVLNCSSRLPALGLRLLGLMECEASGNERGTGSKPVSGWTSASLKACTRNTAFRTASFNRSALSSMWLR